MIIINHNYSRIFLHCTMSYRIDRVLEGHEELVRCIRFDKERIVSGAYDGKIKVWDLRAALDPRSPAGTLCLRTLVVSALACYVCFASSFSKCVLD